MKERAKKSVEERLLKTSPVSRLRSIREKLQLFTEVNILHAHYVQTLFFPIRKAGFVIFYKASLIHMSRKHYLWEKNVSDKVN